MNGLLGWLPGSWKGLVYLHSEPLGIRAGTPSLSPGPACQGSQSALCRVVSVGCTCPANLCRLVWVALLPSKRPWWVCRSVLCAGVRICLREYVHV